MGRHCGPVILCALAVALAYPQEQDIASSQGERNRRLFTNETFGGNGRTCGTCHPAQNNLTIDPTFIATLPQSDPLFVAENNPALAALEIPALLRGRGLIV